MVGRAKSQLLRAAERAETRQQLLIEAVERYKNQASHTVEGGRSKRKSMRTVVREVSNEHFESTGHRVILSQSALSRRLRGWKSHEESREDKSLLTIREAEVVVAYIIELGNRNIPLSHRRLKEHVEEIIRRRNPNFAGVGKNWTHRFITKHHNKLTTYWSRSLDGRRGGAVNPTTNKAWFKLLGDTLTDHSIDQDLIYGTDETGIQPGSGQRERVIGGRGKPAQHQKRSGGRKNITVIVTICADGTSIPPTVIFKGKHYLVKWLQDNPLKASIGHSQKGWATGEIALCWIQEFNARTQEKSAGRSRLLLLDGHVSHLTHAFLEYAREHDIIILCYPSHATHVYQGLDVVCFGPFKLYWSERRDEYENETGLVVQKTNVMKVMSDAYVLTFTHDNIKSAFRKTGVVPYNPLVITEGQMAASVETSYRVSLPIRQPSPIQAVVDAMIEHPPLDDSSEGAGERFLVSIQDKIAMTSAGFLIASSPITADNPDLPTPVPHLIPPLTGKTQALLRDGAPQTEREIELFAALKELARRDEEHVRAAQTATATSILQGLYCAKLKRQLVSKQDNKDKGTERLLGDGMPAMLTNNSFYNRVVAQSGEKEHTERMRAARREAKAEAERQYREDVAKWGDENRKRIEENKAETMRWQIEVANWEIERDAAKKEHRRPAHRKPKKPTMKKPIPKPVKAVVQMTEDSDGDESSAASSVELEDESGDED